LQTWDDVTGVNDPAYLSGTPTWIQYADAPTRLTDASFEVVGDARDTFQIARRLKCIVGAFTLYARVVSASYGTGATTVTVVMDSGTLTADFSSVWYAWVETDPVSVGRASTADSLFGVVLTGAVLAYAGATAPDGFLLCDGTAVSRATYAALYAIIGTIYGAGDGSSTFNLPDIRGYFIRGLNTTSGSAPIDFGRALGNKQDDALKTHTHTADHAHTASATQAAHDHSYTFGYTTSTTPNFLDTGASYGDDTQVSTTGTAQPAITVTVDSASVTSSGPSTGVSTETRPYNIAMNYIIKY
jgi:microcystin-dependent protein